MNTNDPLINTNDPPTNTNKSFWILTSVFCILTYYTIWILLFEFFPNWDNFPILVQKNILIDEIILIVPLPYLVDEDIAFSFPGNGAVVGVEHVGLQSLGNGKESGIEDRNGSYYDRNRVHGFWYDK